MSKFLVTVAMVEQIKRNNTGFQYAIVYRTNADGCGDADGCWDYEYFDDFTKAQDELVGLDGVIVGL